MEFNTSTLGYKLTSGQLKDRRKHSEQLGKYLAGLIDADGCFSIYYSKQRTGTYKAYCFFSIGLTEDIDLVESLHKYYGVGKFKRHIKKGKEISYWLCASNDTKILTNRIAKHLRIKGTHLDNLLWLQEELKGVPLSEDNIAELKEFSKCSRANSRWLKHPKHLSWAWIAGYLDGDGHYRFRENRKVWDKRFNRYTLHNNLVVSAVAGDTDKFILDKLSIDLGGTVNYSAGYPKWTMGLGKATEARALHFLKNMRKYCCMSRKYSIIDRMVLFHEANRQQRLNKLNSNE